MADLLHDLELRAKAAAWASRPVDGDDTKKMGFHDGIELISPRHDLELTILESKEQIFCSIGQYGRFESAISSTDKENREHQIVQLVTDILEYGIVVEVYKNGSHILRTKVFIEDGGGRRLIAKTINGLGFFGGKKKKLVLGRAF